MDVAPEDRCENVRREICLTLERMGIQPESSHHEEGPGQNEVDFRYSDPLSAADNAVTFLTVVKTVAARNGLYADFSPRPLEGRPGSGFHINMSVQGGAEALMHRRNGRDFWSKITDMTAIPQPHRAVLQPSWQHTKRRSYISWSSNNRSQLIRVPAASGEYRRCGAASPRPHRQPISCLCAAHLGGTFRNRERHCSPGSLQRQSPHGGFPKCDPCNPSQVAVRRRKVRRRQQFHCPAPSPVPD